MKRSKKHRVKQELPETSSSRHANQKEHDLAYYIHDRVELMHQVFSVLKPKELKAMAPECVRNISVGDLQELCMEELLGISSKRLCAMLDGATPPSDTESSSESEQLETISLDSISSDEEILSQVSTKKSKKHKHRSKTKSKKRESRDKSDDESRDQADRSRRAGLTVLELLELQARARAIRAQLQQEQAKAASIERPSESATGNSSDDEVEIKEEAAEVVEISSEDEKPSVRELEERIATSQKETATDTTSNSKTVTKKINDLVITVPKTNTSRKIKLKRNIGANAEAVKVNPGSDKDITKVTGNDCVILVDSNETNSRKKRSERDKQIVSTKPSVATKAVEYTKDEIKKTQSIEEDNVAIKVKGKSKDKKRKKRKNLPKDKDGSDHDEITLQLSDTEKMDLLEDLDGKKPLKCDDTEDSSTDSSDEDSVEGDDKIMEQTDKQKANDTDSHTINLSKGDKTMEHFKESESNNVNTDIPNEKKPLEVQTAVNIPTSSLETLTNDEKIVEKDKGMIEEKSLSPINKNKTKFEKDESKESHDEELKISSEDNSINLVPQEISISIEYKEKKNELTHVNTVEITNSNDTPSDTIDTDTNLNDKENPQNIEITQKQTIIDDENQSIPVDQDECDKDGNIPKVGCDQLSDTIKEATDEEPNNIKLSVDSDLPLNEKTSGIEANVKNSTENENEKSDGELSDRDSSEVEASDFKADVVCISDDEEQKKKKKKKKDKKSKKEKKSKKKDFRESSDQNFYTELNTSQNDVITISDATETNNSKSEHDKKKENIENNEVIIMSGTETDELKEVELEAKEKSISENKTPDTDLDDDVYEILELSDDSSCYEVEDITLSKEPTAEEIEALSAKLDEIDRDTSVYDDAQQNNDFENVETVSWKDRYLKSSKVKKVLTTANIMNAMRKKNLELKKKLQESKKEAQKELEKDKIENTIDQNVYEEGSIEQYKTLETSTKYVDPVKEVIETADNVTVTKNGGTDNSALNATDNSDKKGTVSNEMKKDAKQLLKMYKMLLKYNDMTKQKDPNKKKKKKKKSKDKDKTSTGQEAAVP